MITYCACLTWKEVEGYKKKKVQYEEEGRARGETCEVGK